MHAALTKVECPFQNDRMSLLLGSISIVHGSINEVARAPSSAVVLAIGSESQVLQVSLQIYVLLLLLHLMLLQLLLVQLLLLLKLLMLLKLMLLLLMLLMLLMLLTGAGCIGIDGLIGHGGCGLM